MMSAFQSRRIFPALLLAIPLFIYIVYPLGRVLGESFTLPVIDYRARAMNWDPKHQPVGAALRRLASEPNAIDALSGTLKISIFSVLTGGTWGAALAVLWWRREFPGRRIFAALGYTPLLMPPLVGTLAFYRLLGDGGMLWRLIGALFSTGNAPLISGFKRVLLVHTYSFGIYTYAYIAAVLENYDVSREEAARSLGAGRIRTFFAAVWPVIRAPLLATALLTFMASTASFSAPYILDNASNYLTVEIVNNQNDEGLQSALAALLACVALSVLPAFLYFNRQGGIRIDAAAAGIKGTAGARLPLASRLGTMVRLSLSVIAALIMLAPPIMVLVGALTAQNAGLPALWNSLNAEYLLPLGRSGIYGACAAAIDVVLAVTIALVLRRSAYVPSLLVEFAVMLTLGVPGSVVAVGLIRAFNTATPLTLGVPLTGTAAILILAYVIRNLPLAMRPSRSALDAIGVDVEFAAASLGADRLTTARRILVPLMLPSLLSAGLICFINGTGEYVASILLYRASTQPVSVKIGELFHDQSGPAFALALWLMLFSVAAIALRQRLAKPSL